MRLTKILGALLLLCLIQSANAEVPHQFSFQGVLKDSTGSPVADDIYAIKFRIYDDSLSGNIIWETPGYVPIQTHNGLFQHYLGSHNPIPDSITRFPHLWIGMTVNLESEMLPRTKLVSVPFSIEAGYSDTAQFSIVAQSAIQAEAAANAESSQFANQANYSVYADTAAVANVPITYRRIAYDLIPDSLTNTNYEQIGNTLVIAPGQVTSFINVTALVGAHLYAYYKCYYDIRIGQNGMELSKDENCLDYNLTTGGYFDFETVHTIQFYYEPSAEERENGFDIKIFMKVTSTDNCRAKYYRCEVFGI